MGPEYVLLARIFLCTSLLASLAWTADYSRTGAWRNVVGRNLLTKTVIICALLTISLLGSLLRFDPFWLRVLAWTDLVLIAAIGPVMLWRMLVFRKVSVSVVRCLNGHFVSAEAVYCPQCGVPVTQQAAARNPDLL